MIKFRNETSIVIFVFAFIAVLTTYIILYINDIPWVIDRLLSLILTMFIGMFLVKTGEFRGRWSNKYSLQYFVYPLLSILSVYMFNTLLDSLFDYSHVTFILKRILVLISISIVYFFILFETLPLLSLRLQDLNLPGYYCVGVIPIVSFSIGLKIYKSGNRLLGILVFLNLIIAIPYILFVPSNKAVNYFGINSNLISKYKRERKDITNLNYLSDYEINALLENLKAKYMELEQSEKEAFVENEINRLISKEKFVPEQSMTDITRKRREYYEIQVREKLSEFYYQYLWN